MTLTTLVKTSCMSVLLTFLSLICLAQLPHANFTAVPTSGCAPLVVNFIDQSTGSPTSWKWTLGNATTSFLQNPSVTYFNPGTYTVKLVVQNAAGKDSITKFQYITVYGKPTVDFTASSVTGCFPLTVDFTDLSTTAAGMIDNWQWDFGDGNFGTAQNPTHTYTAAGTYNVSLRVRNTSGCYQTLTKPQYITVGNAPVAGFTNSISTNCTAPINIYFQNTSTGTGQLTYFWDFGDGFTSVMANPSHSFGTGTFIVTLVTSNANGCKDTFVIPNPIQIGNMQSSFTSPATVCVGTSFTINNTSSPASVSYFWDFGDGTNDNVRNPTKSYATPGVYLIKLVNNFGSCSDSLTKMITVMPKPVTDFSADITGSCLAPLNVHFTNATTGATQYHWDFGDGSGTSAQPNPTHTYSNSGTYTVTLITSGANGCSDTLVKPQYIHIQPPVASINNLPQQGCAPFSWTFSSTNASTEPVVSYQWDFGDGGTSNLPNPTHIFGPGSYDIQLIITTASGCTDTVLVGGGIKAGTHPHADFVGTPRITCAELPVVFTDLSTGEIPASTWLWDFGDGGTSIMQNPTHTYHDTGFFYIQLIVINNGCPDTLHIDDYIYVNPPVANFAVTANCAEPYKRTFTDHSIGADLYSWTFGDGGTSNIPSPVHIYPAPGIYVTSLTVTNTTTGCTFTKSVNVRIIDEHPTFSAADTTVCRGTPATFTAVVSNVGNIASFGWTFGDGGTAGGRTPSHTYTTAGFYTVRLITFQHSGIRSLEFT